MKKRLNIFNIDYSYFSRINTLNANGGIIYSSGKKYKWRINLNFSK